MNTKMKPEYMIHTVSGNNFHGDYSVEILGPKDERFELSDSEIEEYKDAICPFSDCSCDGEGGSGLDDDSAEVFSPDGRRQILIPLSVLEEEYEAREEREARNLQEEIDNANEYFSNLQER